jgi:mannitol/fructose-specific phosphotransferase system IIA component (Ntr-type)
MNLHKYLTEDTIKLSLVSDTPDELLKEMTDVLVDAGKLDKARTADTVCALTRREGMMSTGLNDGVAIPHAKVYGVKGLVGALGIKPSGIDFGSLDGKPAKIFVTTLSPKGDPVPHVQFLAEVCNILKRSEVRERLLTARSPREVVDILFK